MENWGKNGLGTDMMKVWMRGGVAGRGWMPPEVWHFLKIQWKIKRERCNTLEVKLEKGVRIGRKGWSAPRVSAGPTEKEKDAIPWMRVLSKFLLN